MLYIYSMVLVKNVGSLEKIYELKFESVVTLCIRLKFHRGKRRRSKMLI